MRALYSIISNLKPREFLLTITEAPKAALKSLAERGDTLSKNAQNKLVNTLLDGISVRNERVKSDVEKSGIKLPEEIYSGEEVVKAMKEGTFDFAELVIKRK